MMMCRRQTKWRKKRQRGATTFEGVLAICILFLVFFSLIQIYFWSVNQLVCDYSAFCAGRGLSLGFDYNFVYRGARVAAMSISGKPQLNGSSWSDMAEKYMIYGDASGVTFEYWLPTNSGPYLQIYGQDPKAEAAVTVQLLNAPMLHQNMAKPLGVSDNPDPKSTVSTFNHAQIYLED